MIINGMNVMTTEERKEIISLLVQNGYNRGDFDLMDDKAVAKCLREFRAEALK